MQSDLANTLAELSAIVGRIAVTAFPGKTYSERLENGRTVVKALASISDDLRTGKLIALPDDAIEMLARAICESNVGDEDDWDLYKSDAIAALAALTNGADQ